MVHVNPTRRRLLALVSASLLPAPTWAAPIWHMAVLPAMSARESFALYLGLAEHLARAEGLQVRPEVALDFPDFLDRLVVGQAQLAFGPPHLMRLLQKDHDWHPLAVAQPAGASVLLAPRGFALDKLRGGAIVALDRDAIIVLAMQHELARHGLREGRDYRIETMRGHDSALRALDSGIARAMISRGAGFLSPEARARLEAAMTVDGIPGWIVAASPRVPQAARAALTRGLLSFAATPDGEAFLDRHGYRDLKAPEPAQLATLDAYLDAARRIAARRQ
jgi:ABC-type phosphate/phosphonate transport system substrate-binding protein